MSTTSGKVYILILLFYVKIEIKKKRTVDKSTVKF